MTFTEAAVEVLKREGKPLHFRKIAEIAIRENLLDHVGKIPEETMADQLSAHCKLPRPDRSIVVVQYATFALEEWGLPEDANGLENLVEPPPADELPYRSNERHPILTRELARGPGREAGRDIGRDAGRGRRREEGDEKRRRFPPPAEVAYEILSGAERPMSLRELAALGVERMLMPDAFVREAGSLVAALQEDNRRRESAGRKALFAVDGDLVTLGAVPEPGERPVLASAARASASPAEMRRAALAALRRRLRECDGPTIEYLLARLLEKTGLTEVKVAKRGRESVVFTGRRRMGLADVRHAIRVLRNGADVGRRDVTEVRRDLGHYGAQIGVLVTSGEAQREARAEATVAGQMPVLLLAGEAFAEAFADAGFACRIVSIPEADEAFLQEATEAAQREEVARKVRREERDRREGRDDRDGREERDRGRDRDRDRGRARRDEPRPPVEGGLPDVEGVSSGESGERVVEDARQEQPQFPAGPAGVAAIAALPRPKLLDDGDEEGDEEGDADEGDDGPETSGPDAQAEPGEAGKDSGVAADGRRRRRRRRRRGGRGRGEQKSGTPDAGSAASPSPPADSGGSGPPPVSGGSEGAA